MKQPVDFLERYWGHSSFRPLQEDIINAVLQNQDTFALLPTGGGKSVCFQVPGLMREGICIVVSPLIALMKDQVNNLKEKGIKALAIPSGIHYNELDTLLDNCIYGNYKFLYLSPERLQQELVKERIQRMQVNLIAVDEAHCISQWGNDFRPAYRNIALLRELHPSVNLIALTASAKPNVVKDIVTQLDFIDPKIFKASFNRENIAYMVIDTEDKYYQLEQILIKNKGCSIVYARTRRATLEICRILESKGFSSLYYHGGISSKEKLLNLQLWSSGQKEIMVATTAFGMGIDKADVKNIIHIHLPESIESYYQESGRAGRNGESAYAVILKGRNDINALRNQFLETLPTVDFLKQAYRKLCNYFQISYGEGELTSHQFNFNAFCKTYGFDTTKTFNALQSLDRNSIIALSQEFNHQSKLIFLVSNQALFKYIDTHKELSILVKSILRTYGGIFEILMKIDLGLLSEKTSMDEATILALLRKLHDDGIANFQYLNSDAEITFLVPREDDKTINRISKHIEQQYQIKEAQVNAVIDYIDNTDECKNKQLLRYFGEDTKKDCGICSVCIHNQGKKPANPKMLSKEIILLLQEGPLGSRKIIELLDHDSKTILLVLQILIENDILEITPANKYKIKHT
ncbi:MAG TPA: RecQ family ATP-dependent DNA helicase [Aquaticitalea sp.]|nr:RecQ family ATP-dependent DNA helicase [Aquaticitalea sp.]